MNDIQLVAFDLDGTVLPANQKLSPATIRSLGRVSARGVKTAVATGRTILTIPDSILSLPFLDYVIGCNGAYIKDMKADEVISMSFIDLDTANAVFGALAPFTPEYHIYLADGLFIEDKKDMTVFFERVYVVPPGDKSVFDAVNALYAFAKRVPSAIEAVSDGNCLMQKICCCVSEQHLGSAMSALSTLSGIEAVAINKNDIETTIAGATKGKALLQLCETLHIDKSAVMAFGDSGNDLSMRDGAGFLVAMGNASQDLKDVADFVTDSVDDDGLAKALDRYCG